MIGSVSCKGHLHPVSGNVRLLQVFGKDPYLKVIDRSVIVQGVAQLIDLSRYCNAN